MKIKICLSIMLLLCSFSVYTLSSYAETPENGSTLGWPGIAHTYCGSF